MSMLHAAGTSQVQAPVLPTEDFAQAEAPRQSVAGFPRLKEISRIVNQVVASWHSPLAVAEQRGWHRAKYDRPSVLTFLDDRSGAPLDVHKIVSGRDISPSGFSFTHLDPLACRRAIVTFAFETAPWDAILVRLSWCRFTKAGIYQSGGKFLNTTSTPLSKTHILEELPFA